MKEWWNRRSVVAKVGTALVGILILVVALGGGQDDGDEAVEAAAPEGETAREEGDPTTTAPPKTTSTTGDMTTSPTTTPSPSSTTTTTSPAPTTTTVATTSTTVDPFAGLRFAPFEVSGTGDDVADFAVPDDLPAAVEFSHSGSSNFAVTSHTETNDRIDLLVNTIGSYSGTRPVNLYVGEDVGFLEITADGSWTIRAIPIDQLPLFDSAASGSGDAVLLVINDGGRLSLTHDGESNFAVLSHGESRDLLVNEIGPYDGTVLLDGGALLLEINADGAWDLQLD